MNVALAAGLLRASPCTSACRNASFGLWTQRPGAGIEQGMEGFPACYICYMLQGGHSDHTCWIMLDKARKIVGRTAKMLASLQHKTLLTSLGEGSALSWTLREPQVGNVFVRSLLLTRCHTAIHQFRCCSRDDGCAAVRTAHRPLPESRGWSTHAPSSTNLAQSPRMRR